LISIDIKKLTTAVDFGETFLQLPIVDGHAIDFDHRNAIFGVWCIVSRPHFGLGPVNYLYAGMFWTPYADWIYTVVSLGGVLLICWLVLGRSSK
jgi:hypothetical protein